MRFQIHITATYDSAHFVVMKFAGVSSTNTTSPCQGLYGMFESIGPTEGKSAGAPRSVVGQFSPYYYG